MKYCLKWNNMCSNLKNADEISIQYIEDKGLVDFMQKYAGKRIVLRIVAKGFTKSEITKLNAIKKQYPNYDFTIALDEYNAELISKLKKKELPFYILSPVQDWETLNFYINELNVSDIDLSGALAFELPKVKRFLEKFEVKPNIRITPNYIRSLTQNCPPLKQFFIRPEDIDLYEPYVDILEFEGIEHQDTFYKIYAKEKLFIGGLNQIIYNFPLQIDNLGLIPAFGERRISCGRQCLFGGACHRCDSLANISKHMGPYVRDKIKENLQKQVKINNETN